MMIDDDGYGGDDDDDACESECVSHDAPSSASPWLLIISETELVLFLFWISKTY